MKRLIIILMCLFILGCSDGGSGYPTYKIYVQNGTLGEITNITVKTGYNPVGGTWTGILDAGLTVLMPDETYVFSTKSYPGTYLIEASANFTSFGNAMVFTKTGFIGVDDKSSTELLICPSDTFSLIYQNNSSYTMDTFVFDNGLIDEETHSLSIPPGETGWLGFFPRWSNNNVRFFSGGFMWEWDSFTHLQSADGSYFFVAIPID